MADNFSVSYDEKLYTAGENDYNAIKNSLSTMKLQIILNS